jgi:NAD(P)-dependent dehydrogenase (short-subunit alcohol dehydrogenase family)
MKFSSVHETGPMAGKVVVVTGGGTGIGKSCAAKFLAAGARVVINGRRISLLKTVTTELDPGGQSIAFFPGDLRSVGTCRAIIEFAATHFGRVDVLINNAGIFAPRSFELHSEEDFDAYYETLVKAPFFTTQAAVREFRKVKGGVVINVGSAWAIQTIGNTPSSAYSSAKAALHALTQNLAIELASDNIRVISVAPGRINKSHTKADSSDFHPLGRDGIPEDISDTIFFLASEAASFITGIVLPVDGGLTAGRP